MKIIKIALLLLGLAIIALAVKSLLGMGEMNAAIEAAVVLEEPVVLPENEGRLVVFHGTPEMTSPVYDEELGLTLNTVKALRYKEIYKMTENKDGKSTWSWMSSGTKTLVGEAAVGGFALSGEMLARFPAESDYGDFDAQESEGYSLYQPAGSSFVYVLPEGAYYYKEDTRENHADSRLIRELNQEIIKSRDGTEGYRYRSFDPGKNGEMTFIGRQSGNVLEDSGADGVSGVYSGVMTREEIAKENARLLVMGSCMGLAGGAALVMLAVVLGKRKAGR